MKDTRFGDFNADGSFTVVTPRTPRNWYNYLFNDGYVTCFSQTAFGEGFAQDNLGRRLPIVTCRHVFVVDAETGRWWTAHGLPLSRKYEGFACTHRPGLSVIESTFDGIAMRLSAYVHPEHCGEVWDVALENRSGRPRRLRVIAYDGTDVDGPYNIQSYNTGSAGWDAALNGVVATGAAAFGGPKQREAYVFLAADTPCTGFDTRKNAFIGVYGDFSEPEALQEGGRCRDSDCCGEKICLVLQNDADLAPGARASFRYAVSFVQDRAEAPARAAAMLAVEPGAAAARADADLGGVRLRTPNPDLDFLANTWLERACVLGARWARVRSLGYRDVVSDCDCLAAFNPELAARDLKRMLAYQYSNGYAPRNVLGGSINDKNFADCCVGIPMAAHSIAMELGLESGFLDEEVPFNDGTKASVYEHCRRAMDFLWGFRGLHGLVRIWGGDWNDCMDTVGLQGRGASVWLSMAWCYANRLFGRLAEATGRADDAALSRERGREMADIINEAAWDGGHYLCAYKDDGTKLGSDENEEGRVFLIQQLWSILAGVVTPERLPKVLHAIDVDLHDPMGTLVMAPGYSSIDTSIGYIGTKAPGIHENGGIYLHTLAWKLAAEAVLKRNDKLYETLQQMLPVRDDGTSRPSEPYMISNSIFGPQTGYRYGTPGQSWRTASSQWLFKALVNFVFGLQPAPDGLHLDPCLPAEWPECGIVKRFRGTTYDIAFRHEPGKACNRVATVLVDGAPHDPAAALPLRPGATLRVEVALQV